MHGCGYAMNYISPSKLLPKLFKEKTTPFESTTSWWFQPIWKILAKLDHFPRSGWTLKSIWNHHLVFRGYFIASKQIGKYNLWCIPFFQDDFHSDRGCQSAKKTVFSSPADFSQCQVPVPKFNSNWISHTVKLTVDSWRIPTASNRINKNRIQEPIETVSLDIHNLFFLGGVGRNCCFLFVLRWRWSSLSRNQASLLQHM